ncbi:MAG: LytTR family DNA-binding domain-containing protein [Saprospiraceae bacterium]|nr:LytTR family DNA-binding domain-containing protein [Saprospiraceae bacterium]HMW39068.1 LytTR family DNA-binding domain-containing protein [Saprospiraceae bacterium]HMX88223.1 LytTR family DNA-binding domain-containing protein [Saprospiraceae bacterium]HMZ41050.1 LytTR family DNA-binding domain-containing protein [Saprospiraceae bacterium]HNA64250.1 LytTR family DNA-binding domain-containing protein [Saprospiraceae bacterium]
MKLKCLVIDDDPMICDLVRHFCSKMPQIDYCLTAGTGRDGLQLLASQKFDVLLLDYHLPDMTGHAILEINSQKIPIIMITAEKDFAVTAFEYDEIYDFLVKPLNFDRFTKAIERVSQGGNESNSMVPANEESFYVKDGNKFTKVTYGNLLFIRAEENYVAFVTNERTIMNLSTLKETESRLPPNFMKIHRSYIVNLEKIESATTEEVRIKDHRLPISMKYKKELLQYLANK